MKSMGHFHPFLIVLYPILQVISVNLHECYLHEFVPHILGSLLIAVAFIHLVKRYVECEELAAIISSTIFFAFFLYGLLADSLVGIFAPYEKQMFPLLLWFIATITFLKLSTSSETLRNSKTKITEFFNVLSLILVGTVSFVIIKEVAALEYEPPQFETKTIVESAIINPRNSHPDVYYIVLDGYNRGDVLKNFMSYDNSKFIENLEGLGGFVAKESYSNYHCTLFSLNCSMNMEYLKKPAPTHNSLLKGMGQSLVARVFERNGYESVFICSGHHRNVFNEFDVHLQEPVTVNDFTFVTWHRTPFRPLIEYLKLNNDQRQIAGSFRYLAEQLALKKKNRKPRFVFAHILAPHRPYLFKSDGTPISLIGEVKNLSVEDAKKAYCSYLEYVNRMIIKALSGIEKSQRPIVIIQGDHGSCLSFSVPGLKEKDRHWAALAVLNAYFVPEELKRKLSRDTTPVNTFRLLFSHLFNMELPKLKGRAFYMNKGNMLDFVEIPVSELALRKACK